MRAYILNQPSPIETNPLTLSEIKIPEPAPDELRLKVLACGICHTDLHIVEGELNPVKLPITPGHQVVAVVDKIGEAVQKFKKGDRVGLTWLYSTCGNCSFCKAGLENLCENAQFTGYHHNGGFAQYLISKSEFTFHLPENFDELHLAPLLCAGVIGYRALKLSEAKSGETLGLFGFGASAHIVCQIASYLGIEFYAFTRSRQHQELALKLGAKWAGSSQQTPPKKIDRAIIFAPAGNIVPDALKHLRNAGTLAINAVYMSPIPELNYNKLLFGEKTIRSVSNTTRQDAIELLELAPRIPIKTEIETFEFSELPKALLLLKQSKIHASAVLKIK